MTKRLVVYLLCTDGNVWTSVHHEVSTDVQSEDLFSYFPRSVKPLHLADRVIVVDSDGSLWLHKDRFSDIQTPKKLVRGTRKE